MVCVISLKKNYLILRSVIMNDNAIIF